MDQHNAGTIISCLLLLLLLNWCFHLLIPTSGLEVQTLTHFLGCDDVSL